MLSQQYSIDWIKDLEVSLYNPYDMTELAYYFYHNDRDMEKITEWVLEHNLGERTARHRWRFRDEAALSAFILQCIK